MNVPQKMEASALNTVSIYAQDGQNYTFKKLLAEYQRYPDLCAAIKRNVPLIGESMPAIKLFIEHIRRCEKLHISKTCRCVWTDCCSRLLKKSQSWNRFNCLRTGDGSRKILAGVKVSETEMNDKAACVRCEEAIE